MSGASFVSPGLSDMPERRRALDTRHSFIVQAPAGSGKTGLLIQRYLTLLAGVDAPEEIAAITFTRKAAAEMRDRIMGALGQAYSSRSDQSPETEHEKLTRELAGAALRKDTQCGWNVLENPARLRIQTFDSLCASLTRQMPLLSNLGSSPQSADDASDLYLEAASATVRMVETSHDVGNDIERLLEHLDNDVARLEKLLASMLARRDHWLRHIHGRGRDELEGALKRTRRAALEHLRILYPSSLRDELTELIRYAAANLTISGGELPIAIYEKVSKVGDSPGLADNEEQDLEYWLIVANLLLTKEKKLSWRRTYTIRDGFPIGRTKSEKEVSKSWKERTAALIAQLETDGGYALRHALNDIRDLPPPTYTETQWKVLGSIMRLLPHAVAQLKLVFQSSGKVDFIEVAQGALRALGEPEAPTDLALALDYRLRHLLIDEFQDTSISQFELVSRLTWGWEPGDGRSMLLVGDPMQSIYRFREAEVGLFLRARTTGIGNVALHPISLSSNFRSQGGIVDWVNDTFAQVMPQQEDISLGAVSHKKSISTRKSLCGKAVSIHPFFNDDHAAEAEKVADIVGQAWRENPCATVAILVRNRSHLNEILPRLKKTDMRYSALEIDGLGSRPVVRDLIALTRALTHLADRSAWLAILRAPWCGLTLADMHGLLSGPMEAVQGGMPEPGFVEPGGMNFVPGNPTVWELLNDDSCLRRISADGAARLQRVRRVLAMCVLNRCRQSLRSTVEAAWLALGGPACSEDAADLGDAQVFFDHLEMHEDTDGVARIAELEEELSRLYASPDPEADGKLQIMTIHKAKGLEFDCVILPGLGRATRNDDKKLFMWMEYPREFEAEQTEDSELLLAPIQETGADNDLIYAWLEKQDGEKERFENQRLLYVAATRAKHRLHLLGSIDVVRNDQGGFEPKPPEKKTLLSRIWPVVEPDYREAAMRSEALNAQEADDLLTADGKADGKRGEYPVDQSFRRLVSGWALPPAPAPVRWKTPDHIISGGGGVEYSWVGETARRIGSIVHRWLQRISEEGIKSWSPARIRGLHDTLKFQLAAIGVNDTDSGTAVQRVVAALVQAVTDPRGRWLLGPQKDARNELRMTTVVDGRWADLVIDRTFIDEDGQRWVVDYKTSSHEGADIEGFLDREQDRYRVQLDRYAALLRKMDGAPVRRGLYFPLLGGWREWADSDQT
ncbi:MAG TPA: UvrD-helicase domain-containing protein [Nitrosospira sp.]|nr:UvrD-helicase domain-containing protein [Nitrosospira sp.]